ncbi:MAG: SLC13 family permease [Synergistaceae bacterium]|nr:SLC13 family permease [Synergistaceae bacterium]
MSNEVIALIIISICVLLFVTDWVNTCVAAAMGCVAFTLTGISPFSETFSGFSNPLVILIFCMLIVGDAMMETGLDWVIGRYAVKISKGNERLFIFVAALISGLMSMWMANTAVVACFLPILSSISRSTPNMTMKNMTMSVTFGAMYGGSCTLVGSTSQLAAQGIMYELTNVQFSMFDLMPVGILMLVIFLIWEQLFGYSLGIRVWGDRQHEGISCENLIDVDMTGPGGKRRKRPVFALIFAGMIVFFVFEWIPVQMTALCAALLCLVTGCTEPKEAIRRIDWNCVIFLACCMGLAAGLASTKLGQMAGGSVATLLGDDPSPLFFFALVVTVVMFVSNFLANATTTVIFTPVVVTACQAYGFNILPFCMGVAYAANLACATPFAHAQVTMTMVAGYRFTDYVKVNLPVQLIMLAVMIVFVPLFFPLV